MVWRLGKLCGAESKGLRFSRSAPSRFNDTRCWKMGWDRVSIHDGNVPMGVRERLRWVREEGENGRWTKLQNDSFLIPRWLERSRLVRVWISSIIPELMI